MELFQKTLAEQATDEELRLTDPEAYRRKMEARLPENTCCFCQQRFRGYGNNPSPIMRDGKACEECNSKIVSKLARLQAARDWKPEDQ